MDPDSEAHLLAFDRAHLWHPYTSMTDPTPTRLVTGADGVRLTLGDGRRVVDGMSSWRAAIHGYNHPVLNAAATRQLDAMAHVMFGGLTHEPAVELAGRLIELAPDGLEHVFLADSGSVSVEVAMKMVLQHQRGIGKPARTRFLTVRGGYHGDTFDCMSVCDPIGGMHSMFAGVLPRQVFGDRPPEAEEHITAWAEGFRALAAAHAGEVGGLIVEPLLQGAGGMHPYPAECLTVFREVADEHGFVLVFDEIATGFGRTGHMFAAEAAGVAPDIMCVGKALTAGYLSLAAVLCTSDVARALSRGESGVLMHGPTFMGNPLACAIACASIDLLTSTDWRANIARINAGLSDGLAPVRELDEVVDVRTIGAVGVVQLDHPVDVVKATEVGIDSGVWLRPFRNLIYTMPPYVCTDDEIAIIAAAIRAAGRGRLMGWLTGWEDWLAREREVREEQGLQRHLRPRGPDDPVVDLAGNDYLGLSRSPEVAAAAAEAARVWGAGSGASRLVTGTTHLHVDLEAELADFMGQAAALVMSTGYHANLSVVSALADRSALVVSDAHVHASLIDAARLSRAEITVTPHNDVDAVVDVLAGSGSGSGRRSLVLTESIYSVLGDAAPLVALAEACERYGALLVVDEAHGLGVAGAGGHGLVREVGLAGHPHVVVTATLSKALGAQGGAVLGPTALVDHLVNRARPFIFETALAPAPTAGALAALRLLRRQPDLPSVTATRVVDLAARLGVEAPSGAVVSVPMPSPQVAVAAQGAALAEGIRVGCFRPPSVPDGISRLRITTSAGVCDEDWARACDVLQGVVKEHG